MKVSTLRLESIFSTAVRWDPIRGARIVVGRSSVVRRRIRSSNNILLQSLVMGERWREVVGWMDGWMDGGGCCTLQLELAPQEQEQERGAPLLIGDSAKAMARSALRSSVVNEHSS